jgi:hypothetical protein
MNVRIKKISFSWMILLIIFCLSACVWSSESQLKHGKVEFVLVDGLPFVVLQRSKNQRDLVNNLSRTIDSKNIDYSVFQKRFGIKVANLLYQGQKTIGGTQTRSIDPAIFVAFALSPFSGCKLEFIDSKGLIDPCGGNVFDSRGCTTNDCNSIDMLMVPNYSLEDGNVFIDDLNGQELVDFSPNIESLNLSMNEKFFKALVWKKKRLAEKLLIQNKGLFDYVNANNTSFIHIASANGYSSLVKTLIERGADVNIKTDEGYTPLYFAVTNGWEEISMLLVAHGADQYAVCNQLRGDSERLEIINCN